jgi:sigma-B regulation protein RsbU (phosphoserine phosphatase)
MSNSNQAKKNNDSLLEMLQGLNETVKDLIIKFEEDCERAKEIQKKLIPDKFKEIPGMKVKHRYAAGFKSGGDYLDFFEFDDSTHVGILLSDSTGYGLSQTFMSVLLKMSLKYQKNLVQNPSLVMKKIFEDIKVTMKQKEDFSFFYAVINRKTLNMQYTAQGTVKAFHISPHFEKSEGHIKEIEFDRNPLKNDSNLNLEDYSITLLPQDRLILCSDGVIEAFNKKTDFKKYLNEHAFEDAYNLIHESIYQVKKDSLEDRDLMPMQDSTIFVLDIEKRALRRI